LPNWHRFFHPKDHLLLRNMESLENEKAKKVETRRSGGRWFWSWSSTTVTTVDNKAHYTKNMDECNRQLEANDRNKKRSLESLDSHVNNQFQIEKDQIEALSQANNQSIEAVKEFRKSTKQSRK